jgi:hypothetical protein
VLFTVANGMLLLNVMLLFVGAGRRLYDRLANTIVQVVPSAVDRGQRLRLLGPQGRDADAGSPRRWSRRSTS